MECRVEACHVISGLENTPKALIEDVFDSGSGEEIHAGTGKVAAAKKGGGTAKAKKGGGGQKVAQSKVNRSGASKASQGHAMLDLESPGRDGPGLLKQE